VKHDTAGGAGTDSDRAAAWAAPVPRAATRLRGALVPVTAVATALFALVLYASSGAAGAPPARIEVSGGRVLVPSNPETTSAYFDLRNTGASADTLVSVTSPRLRRVTIARTVVAGGAGRMEPVDGLYLPPGGRFGMTASTTDLMVTADPALTAGRTVDFDLHFAGSGTVRARAVVVPLGG